MLGRSMMIFSYSVVLVVTCSLTSVWAKTRVLFGEEYHVMDDMLLHKDTEQSLRRGEKGILVGTKYPVVEGYPTAYYAFDPERAEIRNVVRQALDNLEKITCFKFIEVSVNDTRSKLWYFKGDGCYANMGYSTSEKRPVSIGGGCDNVKIITHETMHALGFPHTQCRPDRNEYINVLFQNIEAGDAYNYNLIKATMTFGTVYDFSSRMHYATYYFANSSAPTFVTWDPSHLRYIGTGEGMRYSEALILNTVYNCPAIMGKTCTGPTCLNGGFILDNCTCLCPDNYTGSACETYAGPWFKPRDTDKKFNQPGVYLTIGYPFDNNKQDNNLVWFPLPRCYYPKMKVIANNIYEVHWDNFAARMDSTYTYKNLAGMSDGDIINGAGLDVVLAHANKHVKPGRGAQVAIDFIPDGSCTSAYTDFSKIVCTRKLSSLGDWIYETPKYPDNTDSGMACLLLDKLDETKLQSFQVNFDYNLKSGERLEVKHGHNESFSLVGPVSASLDFASSYPTTFVYKASDSNPGYFRYKATAIVVPPICGKITDVASTSSVSQPFSSKFPSSKYPKGVMCNMLFRAPENKKLQISFQLSTLKAGESLIVYTNYKNREDPSYVITQQTNPITVPSNMMLITYRYLGSPVFSSWRFTVATV